MSAKSKRERIRDRRKKDRRRSTIIWVSVGVGVVIVIGIILLPTLRPARGETVAIMPSDDHIAIDSDPGQYNTDPPTSGPHYGSPLDSGFYEESDIEEIGPYPQGYIVHSLEHGYVVLWYNCNILSERLCDELKEAIRHVIDEADNFKVIAFPWETIDTPVVMTSWGRMQRFEDFDIGLATQFVNSNRGKSPEPNAP